MIVQRKPIDMRLYTTKRATMASLSTQFNIHCHVRSISLPTRPLPSRLRTEEELNKLKNCDTSSLVNSDTICSGFSGIGEVYNCIQHLLNSPLIQQSLAHHESLVNELLEGSLRYIDICSSIRDTVLCMKECVGGLQSALRRRKAGDTSIETNVHAYLCSRKKMKKTFAKSLTTLKQVEDKLGSSCVLDVVDHQFSAAVRLLREASLATISILQSLLLFLSVPVMKPKANRWSMVRRLVHKGEVGCEVQEKKMNELESTDVALCNILLSSSGKVCEAERTQSAHRRLEALDVTILSFDNGLECLFRCLVHTRVSLLNILSC